MSIWRKAKGCLLGERWRVDVGDRDGNGDGKREVVHVGGNNNGNNTGIVGSNMGG